MPWSTISASASASARVAVRWLSLHTGLPALVVAAVLVVVGYRILEEIRPFRGRGSAGRGVARRRNERRLDPLVIVYAATSG